MLKNSWHSLSASSFFLLEEKKSKFIGQAFPIHSPEEALCHIQEVKKKYPDARHHVYAWRFCGDEILQRYSDDNEPSGTAGLPVLDVLRKNDIDNGLIVVTRYFGGILLGASGLVRAYTKSASKALILAKPVLCQVCRISQIMVSYSLLDQVVYNLKKADFIVDRIEYDLSPTIEVAYLEKDLAKLEKLLLDMTAGEVVIESGKQRVIETFI